MVGEVACQFMSEGVAAGPDGTVFVASHDGIQKIATSGEVARALGVPDMPMSEWQLAGADAEGNLYVAATDAIRRIAPDGSMGWRASLAGQGRYLSVVVTPAGEVLGVVERPPHAAGQEKAPAGLREVILYGTDGRQRGLWSWPLDDMLYTGRGYSRIAADGKGHLYHVSCKFTTTVSTYRLPEAGLLNTSTR